MLIPPKHRSTAASDDLNTGPDRSRTVHSGVKGLRRGAAHGHQMGDIDRHWIKREANLHWGVTLFLGIEAARPAHANTRQCVSGDQAIGTRAIPGGRGYADLSSRLPRNGDCLT